MHASWYVAKTFLILFKSRGLVMKEHKWEAAVENGQDIFSASLAHEEEEHEIRVVQKSRKSRFTDLRRRIEERLDTKRISMEYDDF
tara:strand:- start:151 stop:408 length:258 start_codon:yes stop_codon:yes gene_type:complete